MSSSRSRERVVCSVCSQQIVYKNLKTHFLRHHPGVSVKYTSATSDNICKFFDGSTAKKVKLSEEEVTDIDIPSTSNSSKSYEGQIESLDSTPACGTSLSSFDPDQVKKLLDKVTGKCISNNTKLSPK